MIERVKVAAEWENNNWVLLGEQQYEKVDSSSGVARTTLETMPFHSSLYIVFVFRILGSWKQKEFKKNVYRKTKIFKFTFLVKLMLF